MSDTTEQKIESTDSTQKQQQAEASPTNKEQAIQSQHQENAVTIQQSKEVNQIQQLVSDMKLTEDENTHKQLNEQIQSQQRQSAKQSQNQLLDDTKYFVQISKQIIHFGKAVLFPGSIQQVDLVIGLKQQSLSDTQSNDPFMLRVIAKCSNPEFDSLDQYVFSVRSNDRFQYFEQVRFKIKKRQRANVKVAVKIPPVKQNYQIGGVLQVQLQGLKPVYLPINAKCQVPQIICMKQLFKSDQNCFMIKVPAKKNQIRMPPIPFKNLSPFNITLQVEAISNQNFSNRAYDIICQNFVNCQTNMQFFVNLQLKQNINYKGVVPLRDTIRKVLILKIKNSSVYFHYPLQVNIYESSVASGMS